MTSVAKPAAGRELLRELRAARNNGDQEKIVELLKQIAYSRARDGWRSL